MYSQPLTHTNTISQLRKQKDAFLRMRSIRDLARLVGAAEHKLQLMALHPPYHVFSIPKRDGSLRWIEDPHPPLKFVQRHLNHYFQSVYYYLRSPAAYGFLVVPRRDPSPRTILTNAERHLGHSYLFNADFEDFFHQVSYAKLYRIFTQPPFAFEAELAEVLASLVCHQERLPMGAPTSPVLSNFATLELDQALLTFSEWAGCTYSRFADDLSFSSSKQINQRARNKIIALADQYGFAFNPDKFKDYAPSDTKIVTGLQLEDGYVTVPDGFILRLKRELTKLKHVWEVQYRAGQDAPWVEKYRQQVEGKVNFVRYVLGDSHPDSEEMTERLEEALSLPDEFEPISWLEFNYVNW
ncbi:MAG: reverse transcriptase family protein [Bacteroidota bacterium]